MVCHWSKVGVTLLVLLLVNLMPVVPGTEGTTVPQEPVGTRGTIVVNASGGGDYTHIQWAIDNASDGDTVYVEASVYEESVIINKRINLIGEGRNSTTIDGMRNDDVIKIVIDGVKVDGFKVIRSYSYRASGISIESDNCIVSNCELSDNYYGIKLTSAGYNEVSNNICFNNKHCGIYATYSHGNELINNTCVSNGEYYDSVGIGLSNSDHNNILRNLCFNHEGAGISVRRSSSNRLSDNIIFDNGYYGILIDDSVKNTLFQNEMQKNGIHIRGDRIEHWNTHSIDSSNSVNGKPFCYLKNSTGENVPPNQGQIILANCTNIVIENQEINNTYSGIQLGFSSGNLISNSTCNSNYLAGIFLKFSNDNTINNSIFNNNYYGLLLECSDANSILNSNFDRNNFGVHLWKANNSMIINNTCNNNTSPEYDDYSGIGLKLYISNDNMIMRNDIMSNDKMGIHISISKRNNIVENNILNNGYHGMILNGTDNIISDNQLSFNKMNAFLLDGSSNSIFNNRFENNKKYGLEISSKANHNLIYYNSFINNNGHENQARDNGTGNNWNYSHAGNFWSEWTTPDDDDDGIIDMPYPIDGTAKSVDHFPVIEDFKYSLPIADAGHNVSIDQDETITFDGTNSRGFSSFCSFTWIFDYDDISHHLFGPSPSFTFSIPGIYQITLIFTDGIGRSSEDTIHVTVNDNKAPNAYSGANITINQHMTVPFNGTGSYDNVGIVNYTWAFIYREENMVLHGPGPTFTFHDAGDYTVTLNVTDAEGNWDTDSLNVTVRDITPPIADAGPDITLNGSDTLEFLFHQHSADNVGISNWTWTFEYNGTVQAIFHSVIMSSLPIFKFDIPGIYTVTMYIRDKAGNWAIDFLNVTVLDNVVPRSDIWGEHTIGANTPFRFDSSSCWDNVAIINWTWKFEYGGKMVFLYGPYPSFRFEIPGKYEVQLIVMDANRNGESSWMTINVEPVKITPGDYDVGPMDDGDKGKEKDSKVTVWIWLGLVIIVIIVVAVFWLFFRKSKEIRDEEPEEDEMGRIGKDSRINEEG